MFTNRAAASLVRPFIELCMFRAGPQDLPPSTFLLGVSLAAHALASIFGFLVLLPLADAVFAGILGTALLCALTYSLLALQRRQPRATQTITALAGSLTVLHVVGLPFAGWLKSADEAGLDGGMPLLIVMILTGWQVTVQGHILRHALSAPLMVGLLVSMLFFTLSVTVLQTVFPPATF